MKSRMQRSLVVGISTVAIAAGAMTAGASTTGGSGAVRAVGPGNLRAGPSSSGLPTRVGEWPVTECGTYSGSGCSPTAKRVDLERPTFSNPTNITNPLFPISTLDSVVLLGEVDGKPFRAETKRLPLTDVACAPAILKREKP